MPETGAERVARSIRAADGVALVPFLTSGFPDPGRFLDALEAASRVAAVCEVGIPFSDPMADGVTIQRTSSVALEHGTTLASTFDALQGAADRLHCPVVFMSYLNPLLNFGVERLVSRCSEAGVSGFIIPDLPADEDPAFWSTLRDAGLATIQLVTPLTEASRRASLVSASTGFLYAVTRAGTTGSSVDLDPVVDFLDALRAEAPVPVCAGFGIREAAQVSALRGHADGVIVGSALLEALERGEDPGAWLKRLKG